MRRVLFVVVVAATLLLQSVGVVVGASPSARGTTTIRYQSAEYFDFVLGATVVCTGIHQHGPRWPGDAMSGGRDVFRCRSTSGPFTNVHHEDRFVSPPFGWYSDYFFFDREEFVVNTRPMRIHMAGNNLSYQVIAYYSEP